MAAPKSSNLYKIKLRTGRVLGPIDCARIEKLARKGHVLGDEVASLHPGGEWKPLAKHDELARLILSLAAGSSQQPAAGPSGTRLTSTGSAGDEPPAGTQILETTRAIPPETAANSDPAAQGPQTSSFSLAHPVPDPDSAVSGGGSAASAPLPPVPPPKVRLEEPEERTVVGPAFDDDVPQALRELEEEVGEGTSVDISVGNVELPHVQSISQEKTVVFQRSSSSKSLPGKVSSSERSPTRRILVLLGLFFVAVELLGDFNEAPRKSAERVEELRPRLPSAGDKKRDPAKSEKLYLQGLEAYRMDSLLDYRKAAGAFLKAAEADPENVRALAMLASSYLNLIDASNKDEKYFSVIQKLIDLSRAKNIDLTETLIAEVEFLLFSQNATAAQNRLIEYTKTHRNYDAILYVYLAEVLLARGDYATAARYLGPISDDKPYSVKVFHLRGQVAEGLGDQDAALGQYRRAVGLNPNHGLSRYRILKILDSRGQLRDGRDHLVFLSRNPALLPPRELARVHSWRATTEEADGRVDVALGMVERALRLEPDNSEYNLQNYLLRARAGDATRAVRRDARLYYHLAEGERLARAGRVEEALLQFLDARKEDSENPLPLAKRGDLFYSVKKDIVNARIAYQKAAELAPRDVRIWSRYIELLIQSYEWDEAGKAMGRFRGLPVPQGIIDKVSGDWNARQGRHMDALADYRKAMSRSYIDPGVYLAYGKSLLATQQFAQAPAIFSLALRNDPDNPDAILGTATALAGSEGIDRAVAYLQDEVQKGRGTRVELLCGIASFLIQKGGLDQAQELIDQGKRLRPEAAQPWKAEAELMLARGSDRKWKQKADDAYRAYLDRNPGDAAVLYERFRILMELEKYEPADLVLGDIYQSYPKFPSLHYAKGLIYMRLSNYQLAIREFEQEIKNGNGSTQNLLELGKANLELKNVEAALGYFVRAIQQSPKASEPKLQAGRANFALGRYDAAVALYQEAIKVDSGNPAIYRNLGYAYRAMGDYGSARGAFSKYLEMEPDAADKAEIQQNL